MQDDIFSIKSNATGVISAAPSVLTTPEEAWAMEIRDTTGKLNKSGIVKGIKDGHLTPEEAVAQAFPLPFVHIKDVSIERLHVEPLATGFKTLDEHLVLKKDRPELIVVGAGTSHGKSAFMVQVAANVSQHGPVFVFSLEMDERDIKARLLAPRINTPLQQIMAGRVDPRVLRGAAKHFENMHLQLCTDGKRDVAYIQQMAYDMAKRVGNPLLIVCDYLQLMRGVSKATRTAEIAEIMGSLKELAKTLKCPIMIGSQLNRECERRGKKIEMEKGIGDYRPLKSDLMDSGSIEHDADVILFISRQYVYDRTRMGEADFTIAKNRAGKLCDTVFQFTGELCIFQEVASAPGYGI